ncbi:MAG TPA: TetR/AcrR family transcriptional regulator C-terminal domain-containing protein [Candidatus Saccharimonadales bacterium]|nr:TetR/AcrR family transcriptional regulator C-terminal domain-containing protein [Candidatus Saccharimonadales bacterium]
MNREDRHARDLARLEAAQRHTRERMAREQERIDQRFEKMREKLSQKYGESTTDHQQRIIEAALELLKEDGLNNLSLRRLARSLHMQAPALYWHFKSKEELVDYMAEAILAREFKELVPRKDDESWQDWLANHMMRLRRAMLAYPDGGRVVAGAHLSPAITLARSLEAGLISLSSAGFDLKTARQIMVTATTYTFGCVIEEQAGPTPEQLAAIDLQAFLEPYPHIAEALDGDLRHPESQSKYFLQGLEYIIRGAGSPGA